MQNISEVTVTVDDPKGGKTVRHLEISGHGGEPERLADELVNKLRQAVGSARLREIRASR